MTNKIKSIKLNNDISLVEKFKLMQKYFFDETKLLISNNKINLEIKKNGNGLAFLINDEIKLNLKGNDLLDACANNTIENFLKRNGVI